MTEFNNNLIKFFHQNGINYYYIHPEVIDCCFISTENTLFILQNPTLKAKKNYEYNIFFNKDELKIMRHKTKKINLNI